MYRKIRALLPLFIYRPLKSLAKEMIYLAYKGDLMSCIICGATYRTFIPYNGRKNAGCICCESLERHRMMWYYFQHQTDLFQKASLRVLHVAPENWLYKKFRQMEHVEYYPCDLNPEMYKEIRDVMAADIEKLSFEDDFFDLVICSHVLEHVHDDRKAMREMHRVLKKGGQALFMVPIAEDLSSTYEDASITTSRARKKAFGQWDHVRLYGKDFVDRLKKVSFRVKEEDVVATMPKADVLRYGFARHETMYCCTK